MFTSQPSMYMPIRSSEVDTSWPSPVRSREKSAAATAPAAAIPAMWSPIPPLRERQVQADAALVSVVELERRRHTLDDPGQEAPERVAVGRLDLHDVGAPVAEDRGPGRARDPHPHLDDLHAVHRSWHVGE